MEQIISLKQYDQLLKNARKTFGRLHTNCFLLAPETERIILQRRLYFEETDKGLLFYSDEKKYYQVYFYISSETKKLNILPKEKPILVRTIYIHGSKSELQKKIDRLIGDAGFSLLDSTTQVYTIAKDNLAAMNTMYERIENLLKDYGMQLVIAGEEHLDEILELRDNEPELKLFHIPFYTREEELQLIEEGCYACIINQSKEICAARQIERLAGSLYSPGFCVKSEYKDKYGLGIVMTGFEMKYACEHGLQRVYGWIANDNIKSWNYHKRLGVLHSGKAADEWVMQKYRG